MLHRVRTLVAVLALGISGVAAAQPAKKRPDPVSTFLQQDKYTYCDVKVLSSLWKVSIRDAKANVGRKLQSHNTAYIEKQLGDGFAAARKNAAARCTFADAGFTYDDAKKLAKLWRKTEAGAKAMVENKMRYQGGEQIVRELLGQGGAATDPTSTFLQQDKYTYCDVKLLSGLWRTSISEAKATIGLKLQSRNETYLDGELAKARRRPKQRCSYDEAGLSYSDIEKLSKIWKVSVAQAKVKAGRKVTANGAGFLREMLGGPGTEADADLSAFLQQDKYTYCDAAMIGAMWKTSTDDAKAFIGAKLRMGSKTSIDRTLVDARTYATKHPVAGCPTARRR